MLLSSVPCVDGPSDILDVFLFVNLVCTGNLHLLTYRNILQWGLLPVEFKGNLSWNASIVASRVDSALMAYRNRK